MSLSHEHVGLKISAKIKIYPLTRAELLFPLCYEIPCSKKTAYNRVKVFTDNKLPGSLKICFRH